MLEFDRPVGAQRDVQELEFVSALMQTASVIRTNGSIDADDISLYLKSRYGVVVDKATVRQKIVQELAGQTGESCEYLDICQFVSVLLIPFLVEETEDAPAGKNSESMDFFFRSLFPGKDAIVTVDRLRSVFESFTELNVSDKLVKEMVEVAGGTRPTMGNALAGDVLDYRSEWKDRKSLNYDDVLRSSMSDRVTIGGNQTQRKESPQEESRLTRIYTAPSVDYVAETYKRPLFVMALWVCGKC
jgi:hypothetical protein